MQSNVDTLRRCRVLALRAMMSLGSLPRRSTPAAAPLPRRSYGERARLLTAFSAAEADRIERILDLLPASSSRDSAAERDCGGIRSGPG